MEKKKTSAKNSEWKGFLDCHAAVICEVSGRLKSKITE
jgi:hypothetical protein